MLKLNSGFEVRNVCGENIVVAMGEHNIDFSHVIALNETSLLIWSGLERHQLYLRELCRRKNDRKIAENFGIMLNSWWPTKRAGHLA